MSVVTSKLITLVDGTEFELPFADLLPDLSPEDYSRLRDSILTHGIQVPIEVTDDRQVIDGQHRLLVAKELGFGANRVPQQPYLLDSKFPAAERFEHMRQLALSLNLDRRHLVPEARADLIAELKSRALSNRAIAKQIGVSEKTVRRDLQRSGAANAAPEQAEEESLEAAPDTIPERREKVKKLKDEGKSVRQIAADVGVSVGTVAADLRAPDPDDPYCPHLWSSLDGDSDLSSPIPQKFDPIDPEDPEEWLDKHQKRVASRLDSEATVHPLWLDKEKKVATGTTERARIVDAISVIVSKTGPTTWDLVNQLDDEVVGRVLKGDLGYKGLYGAYLFFGDQEQQLLYWNHGSGLYPSLKSIPEDANYVLKNADSTGRLSGSLKKKSVPDQTEAKKPAKEKSQKSPKPAGEHPFHALDLGEETWKESNKDLITSSWWQLGARAQGDGRSAEYHGNFVPQIPDQILRRYTKPNDIVLDLFLGGGTTMVEAIRLQRHFIGIDIRMECLNHAEQARKKMWPSGSSYKLLNEDAADEFALHSVRDYLLDDFKRTTLDHVFLHPPYMDIIEFSDDPDCLSRCPSEAAFLQKFFAVAENAYEILEPGKFATLVIGDVWKEGRYVPLGFRCMSQMEGAGFALMSINVKDIQGNEKGSGGEGGGLQRYRSLKNGTSVFGHEYVMVFRKPVR